MIIMFIIYKNIWQIRGAASLGEGVGDFNLRESLNGKEEEVTFFVR